MIKEGKSFEKVKDSMLVLKTLHVSLSLLGGDTDKYKQLAAIAGFAAENLAKKTGVLKITIKPTKKKSI